MQRKTLDDNIINGLTREISRRRREKIIDAIMGVLGSAFIGLFFAWVLANWITGCGEVFYTADGTVMGECVFMPWRD